MAWGRLDFYFLGSPAWYLFSLQSRLAWCAAKSRNVVVGHFNPGDGIFLAAYLYGGRRCMGLFRAESWDAAINILQGMRGTEGRVVVTVGYVPIFEALRPVIGDFKVSAAPLIYFDGRSQVTWLIVALFLSLVFPNTQQWARRYVPFSDTVMAMQRFPRSLLWRPTPIWATFTVILVSVALIFSLQPSEFLYWQF